MNIVGDPARVRRLQEIAHAGDMLVVVGGWLVVAAIALTAVAHAAG